MLKLYLTLQNLRADERGVTAIEYAMLAGAVALGLTLLTTQGGENGVFGGVVTTITDALPD